MSAPTVIPLSWEERAATGYTHKFTITHTNMDSGWTSGSAYAIITLAAGQAVERAAYHLVTTFSGSGTDLTVKLGDGNDDDRFIVAKSVHASGSYVTDWCSTASTLPFAYTSSDTVDVIFTSTGGTLAGLTAGEIAVFLRVVDLTKL